MPYQAEHLNQLTTGDVNSTRGHVGTFTADEASRYLTSMERVYTAAEILASFTAEDLRAQAEHHGISLFSETIGRPYQEVDAYYDAVRDLRPGSDAWREAVMKVGPVNRKGSAKTADLALRQTINSEGIRIVAERRSALLDAQARIKSELEALTRMKVPGATA